MSENTEIIIELKEYMRLLYDSRKLNCLENAGVENWDGYNFAMETMEEIE